MNRFRALDGFLTVFLAVSGGATLGLAAALPHESLGLAILFILLALVGEWLEVRLASLGSISLRPAVAFVALWIDGPGTFFLAGLVPGLLFTVLRASGSWASVFRSVGSDAVGLWGGFILYSAVSTVSSDVGILITARAASLMTFWVIQLALRLVLLVQTEGLRYQAALREIVRVSWKHCLALTSASVILSLAGGAFGVVFMAMATIMLVEAYYPWKLLGEQENVLLTSLQMMAQAVDLKDPYTSRHSQRVAIYAVRIARALGLPEEEVEKIRLGALMHDIGKIGISGRIIRKPGRLTPEERQSMERHSSVGADIIAPLEIVGEAAEMVRHHHEHWDGSGYPDGLKGEAIPLGSRIILVADAFDALITDRPYRQGASRVQALDVIRSHAGTQFDPRIVSVLVDLADRL